MAAKILLIVIISDLLFLDAGQLIHAGLLSRQVDMTNSR